MPQVSDEEHGLLVSPFTEILFFFLDCKNSFCYLFQVQLSSTQENLIIYFWILYFILHLFFYLNVIKIILQT